MDKPWCFCRSPWGQFCEVVLSQTRRGSSCRARGSLVLWKHASWPGTAQPSGCNPQIWKCWPHQSNPHKHKYKSDQTNTEQRGYKQARCYQAGPWTDNRIGLKKLARGLYYFKTMKISIDRSCYISVKRHSSSYSIHLFLEICRR